MPFRDHPNEMKRADGRINDFTKQINPERNFILLGPTLITDCEQKIIYMLTAVIHQVGHLFTGTEKQLKG